ncbi:hypothetical protein, partial [Methanobrevibacter sp.]
MNNENKNTPISTPDTSIVTNETPYTTNITNINIVNELPSEAIRYIRYIRLTHLDESFPKGVYYYNKSLYKTVEGGYKISNLKIDERENRYWLITKSNPYRKIKITVGSIIRKYGNEYPNLKNELEDVWRVRWKRANESNIHPTIKKYIVDSLPEGSTPITKYKNYENIDGVFYFNTCFYVKRNENSYQKVDLKNHSRKKPNQACWIFTIPNLKKQIIIYKVGLLKEYPQFTSDFENLGNSIDDNDDSKLHAVYTASENNIHSNIQTNVDDSKLHPLGDGCEISDQSHNQSNDNNLKLHPGYPGCETNIQSNNTTNDDSKLHAVYTASENNIHSNIQTNVDDS